MDLIEASAYHLRHIQRQVTLEQRSVQTVRSYRTYETLFLAWLTENDLAPTFDALNPQFALECAEWLRLRSTGKRGGLTAAKQLIVTLKTWARFLMDEDIYPYDPLSRLRTPRVPKIHRKPFTPDEAKRLVAAAANGANPVRDRAILLILFDTACRVGELLAATVEDVDLAEGSISFRRTKNHQERKVIFRVTSRRDGGPCLAAVRTWLKVREAHDDVDALFTTREKRALSTRRVRELFHEWGEQARVPNAHPHRCRHTGASQFLSQRPGAENQLRSRLGHLSHDVLQDYITISDPTAFEAAEVASVSLKWGL